MSKPKKLKRVVIKEELVALTGHYIKALILNQMIYWCERVNDFDLFLAETKRRKENVEIELQHGWIYKNAKELSQELMIDASHQTIRRYMQALVESGLIQERHNPKHTWDRTMQYRVDLIAIAKALNELGYTLEGYANLDDSIVQNGQWSVQTGQSKVQNGPSNVQPGPAIPEITLEITTESEVSAQSEPVDQPVQPLSPPNASIQEKDNVKGKAIKGQSQQQQPPPEIAPPSPPRSGFRFTDADIGAGPKPTPAIDPRQLQDGLYPAGSGKTPYQVYREAFAVTPTKIQIRHMNANVTDLDKWREITLKCALKGFKSYDNVFSVYMNGFDRSPTHDPKTSNQQQPAPLDVDWAQFGSL